MWQTTRNLLKYKKNYEFNYLIVKISRRIMRGNLEVPVDFWIDFDYIHTVGLSLIS